MKTAVIGLGFVGGSMKKSFEMKGASVIGYDKYKEGSSITKTTESGVEYIPWG